MRRFKLQVFTLLLTLPFIAQAQVPELAPLAMNQRYDISVGALPIGRLRITASENRFSYKLSVDTKTSGLVKLFAPMQSLAKASGTRTEDGAYQPLTYSSIDKEREGQHTTITYQDGQITERERVPMDDPAWRAVVPIEEASQAVDPITGFFQLRQALRNAMANEGREATVRTYDGARLAEMKIKVISRSRVQINNKYVDAINTVVTRQPIKGYTPKELKKFKAGDPVIHAYFSPDAKFMPLMVTISLSYGDVKAVLSSKK